MLSSLDSPSLVGKDAGVCTKTSQKGNYHSCLLHCLAYLGRKRAKIFEGKEMSVAALVGMIKEEVAMASRAFLM
jgi:hypothetical protein